MKKIIIVIFSVLLLSCGCKAKKLFSDNSSTMANSSYEEQAKYFREQSTWILGYFTKERLLSPPHSEWYNNAFENYQYNIEAADKLNEISTDDLTIKIVMGSWCPDSRREVPRFMRIMDLWKFPVENITFIGVDDLKLSPVGEYENLNIQRVPTFIIYKNNIEAGRIIENPLTSLEQDILNILKTDR